MMGDVTFKMRNIRLTLEYDGTRFRGWKSPKKEESSTISGRLGEVLRRMTGEEIVLFCAEKTEPGVHATCQVVQFQTECRLSLERMKEYMNHYLPLDLAVSQVEEVEERFHGELTPHKITYEYRIQVGTVEDVFRRRYVDFRKEAPEFKRMEDAAVMLEGKHDFRAFSAGRTKKSTVRELTRIRINMVKDEVHIQLQGRGFLKQMPEKLFSVLLDIGYGAYGIEEIPRMFQGNRKITTTCEEKALFLTDVTYDL